MPPRAKTQAAPTDAKVEKRFRGTRLPRELDEEIQFMAEVYGTTVTDIITKGMSEYIARKRQASDFKERLRRRNEEREAIADRLRGKE